MKLPRFFVSPSAFQDGQVSMRDSAAHQILHVLRLRAGQHVLVLDNSGIEHEVELEAVTAQEVRGRVVGQQQARTEPRVRIALYQALLKQDKFEWVLQKGTELGIAAFVPVVTERVVRGEVSAHTRERWQRIVREAAEQSERGVIPSLREPVAFADAIQRLESDALSLIPYEAERAQSLREVLRNALSRRVVNLFIGPEGGFTQEEVEAACQHGLVPLSLGPRILRAETAGLVAASAILYEYGDL